MHDSLEYIYTLSSSSLSLTHKHAYGLAIANAPIKNKAFRPMHGGRSLFETQTTAAARFLPILERDVKNDEKWLIEIGPN